MSDAPVRQHWVPKVYLRAFCTEPKEREQVFVRDLASGGTFVSSLSNVAVKKHFYTLGRTSISPSYAVEEALGQLESDVRPLLSALRMTQALPQDPTEFAILSRFLATLHIRTRQGQQIVHGYRDEVRATSSARDVPLQRGNVTALLALDDEEMREFFATSAIAVGAKLGERLAAMHWRLIRATSSYFLTSENPVFSFHPTEDRWGLETPGVHILCPISPALLVHISHGPPNSTMSAIDATSSAVQGLNGLIVQSAEQYIYSDQPFDSVEALLRDRGKGTTRAFGPV